MGPVLQGRVPAGKEAARSHGRSAAAPTGILSTMRITLDYGTSGLTADLPEDCTVVRPDESRPLADPASALLEALRRPMSGATLAELARPGQRVVIAVPDGTRPHPQRAVIEAMLTELARVGADGDVAVLVAGGTHQADPPDVIQTMLGRQVLDRCEVAIHDCRDAENLVALGAAAPPAADVEVALDRRWVEADLRLSTGLVEPHLFAGFSGGPKLVAIGTAGLETVMALHKGSRVGEPQATWGVVEGNPVHDAIRAVAALAPPHFSVEVVLGSAKRLTHVFAGTTAAAHQAAAAIARQTTMRRVDQRFPLVITSGGGYPLDQNFYQAIKGVSAAAEIVADGGTIVLAAECRYGLPNSAVYQEVLRPDEDIRLANARILQSDEVVPDQWQVQVQTRIQAQARVLVEAAGLTPADLATARLEPVDDIAAFVRAARRKEPRLPIAVLPHGPYCIPFLAERGVREQ
jgi:nickel-dependent lactate racemase